MSNTRIEMSRTLLQKRIDSSLRGWPPAPSPSPTQMPAFISSPKVTSLHSALAQSFITTTSSPFLFLLHLKWFRSQLPSVPTRRTPVNLTCPDHATLGSAPVKRHYLGKLEASLSPVSLIGPCALAIQTRRHRIRTSSTQLFRACCPGRTRIALLNLYTVGRRSIVLTTATAAAAMSTPCPFRISRTASDRLARNEAFRAIRENLRRQELGSEAPRCVVPFYHLPRVCDMLLTNALLLS